MGSPTRRHRNTHTKPTGLGSLISHQLTQPEGCAGQHHALHGCLAAPLPLVSTVGYDPTGKPHFFRSRDASPRSPWTPARGTGVGGGIKKNGAQQQAFRSLAGEPQRGNFSDTSSCTLGRLEIVEKREEQIGTRQDESQWIVAQRPLSAPTIPRFDTIVCRGFPHSMMRTALNTDPFNGKQGTCDISRSSYICSCSHGVEEEHSMSAWILA